MRKTKTRVVLGLCLAVIMMGQIPALAGSKQMLLLLPGFPGNQVQAKPFLDRILRYLEVRMGWEKGSLNGRYLSDGKEAATELREKKPEFAVVGPSIYASQKKAMGMKVIAKVKAGGRGEEVYSVVTLKEGPSSLAELVGKRVEGVVNHDPRYVCNVIFDGALKEGSVTLVAQKRPLKSLRSLSRNQADAAIVDASVVAHMKELPFADKLRIIHTSKPVPAPAVVVMGTAKKWAPALKKVLVGLCKTKEGADLCGTLTISSIQSARDEDYKKLLKRYHR